MGEKPCWRTRECAPEVQETCRHAVSDYDMCPTKCYFGVCQRPTQKVTSDPALVFAPDIDRTQALKQSCIYCEYFLKHGPKREAIPPELSPKSGGS